MQKSKTLAAVALATSLLVPVASAAAANPSPPTAPPGQILPEPMPGERALAALGSRVNEVAQRNGRSVEKLTEVLTGDDSLWVDRYGELLYMDPAPGRAEMSQPDVAAGPFPNADTFALHSKPGSSRVIYLDFDGRSVSGTQWNTSFALPDGTYPGFDTDGSPTTFNQSEIDVIQSVFLRVAEDYAPFDVDVTTQDPGAAALERSSSSDQQFGAVALISSSSAASQQICSSNCGGIAYVGVYGLVNKAVYQPAWVFPHLLGNSAKNIAEASSHEVGHNLGLSHDGNASGAYYYGHNGWAPIMGVGYQQPVVQFSKGEYTGSTNTEDDFTVIGANGLSFRPDDAGGSISTAVPLGTAGTASGVVEQAPDVDMFAIQRNCTDAATITAAGAPLSPNLDISLRLLDASGQVLASSDPPLAVLNSDTANGLGASVSTTLAPGTYYVEVSGVGYGSSPSVGYTDYGSLGQYNLAISTSNCSDVTPPLLTGRSPDVDAVGVPVASVVSATFDETVTGVGDATFTVVNGTTGAGVAGTVAQVPGTNTWTFDPAADLATSTSYTVALTGGASAIRGTAGNAFAGATWSFTTAAADPTEFAALTPVRAVDTRNGVGVPAGAIPAGGTLQVPMGGRLGVPANAAAVSVNVTVVSPSAAGNLTVYPCGTTRPSVATVVYARNVTLGNAVLAKLGSNAAMCLYASTSVQVYVDLNGYFPSASKFGPLSPVRASSAPISAGGTLQVTLAGVQGVPAAAKAVAANVTVVSPAAAGTLTVYPCGETRPTTSTVSYARSTTLSVAAPSKVGTNGRVCIYASSAVNVQVDLYGYFPTDSGFVALNPVRAADTRNGTGVPAGAIPAGGTLTVPIAGRLGVPGDAKSASVHVTVISPAKTGTVTVFPCGMTRPATVTLNYRSGVTQGNAALAKLGSSGAMCVYASTSVQVTVDLDGYYPAGPGA